MKKDFTEKILFGVFAIVGAIFLIVAIAMVCVQIQFKQNADPVTAVIDRIETHRDSDGDYSHSVSHCLQDGYGLTLVRITGQE